MKNFLIWYLAMGTRCFSRRSKEINKFRVQNLLSIINELACVNVFNRLSTRICKGQTWFHIKIPIKVIFNLGKRIF
jgi:hypothetical protein